MVKVDKKLRPDAVTCKICEMVEIVKADSLITHLSHHHPGISFGEYEEQYGSGMAQSLRDSFKKSS